MIEWNDQLAKALGKKPVTEETTIEEPELPKRRLPTEIAKDNVVRAELELLHAHRELAVLSLRLQLARETIPAIPEAIMKAAQNYRSHEHRVVALGGALTKAHIACIEVLANAQNESEQPL